MPASNLRLRAHMLSLLVIGGAILFAFIIYLGLAFCLYLWRHPQILVYGYTALIALQLYWLLFAFLRRRFSITESP